MNNFLFVLEIRRTRTTMGAPMFRIDAENIDTRIKLAHDLRLVLLSRPEIKVLYPLGSGGQSETSLITVKDAEGKMKTAYAVLKCSSYTSRGAQQDEMYESLVLSLTSRLVMSKISPHFPILYNVDVSFDGRKCKMMEKMAFTLESKFVKMIVGDWNKLCSLFAQVTHGLLAANTLFRFQHNDLKLDNIMGDKVTSNTCYIYRVNGVEYKVPLCGFVWKIIDFDHADVWGSNERMMSLNAKGTAGTHLNRRQLPLSCHRHQVMLGPVNDIFFLLASAEYTCDGTRIDKTNVEIIKAEFKTIAERICGMGTSLDDQANEILRQFLAYCVDQLIHVECDEFYTFDLDNPYDMSGYDGTNFPFASTRPITLKNRTLMESAPHLQPHHADESLVLDKLALIIADAWRKLYHLEKVVPRPSDRK